jgi:hypothetical protein
MNKETAVEWLIYIINDFDKDQKFANEILDQAKEMQKEELEKELNAFFLFIRNSGEHFIGMSIEQFVKKYLEGKPEPIINTLSRAYILPESSGLSETLGTMNAYTSEVMRNGGYMSVERREYEAIKSELEELRAFKVNHSATFDAPTEYGKDWKEVVNSGKTLIDKIGNEVVKHPNGYDYNSVNGLDRFYETWEECWEYMNNFKGWRIKE